jgi:hypothetical protein
MSSYYFYEDFDLGTSAHSGHEFFPKARFSANGKKFILKSNKHGRAVATRLEIAFSKLAQLFLAPCLTSSQSIVIKDAKVWGSAVDHICYFIDKKEGLHRDYYRIEKKDAACKVTPVSVTRAEDIPVYFFDQLPHEYFSKLVKAQTELSIDYASLANIMATSYFLEEDDLHKGNFGFYIKKTSDKPRVHFFKIDHDLMFIDNIMSQASIRFFHWTQNEHAFDITARDLIHFPKLLDSKNSYWPTTKSTLRHPFQDKEYRTEVEVDSFAALANNEEFRHAKWLAFYKHILMPISVIHENLRQCYDCDNEYERAQLALVLQAAVARQARLTAVLFSVKEFRDFVRNLSQDSKKSVVDEIAQKDVTVRQQVQHIMQKYAKTDFEEGDTPLHVAIKLGAYRYEESIRSFKGFINRANAAGKRPVDCALEQAKKHHVPSSNPGENALFTLQHLVQNGADKPLGYVNYYSDYEFKPEYCERAKKIKNYEELLGLLTEVGEDHRYCLKHKKNIAFTCLSECIKSKPSDLKKILQQFKKQVNAPAIDSGGLAYIRQLRSSLWIVRQLRGLYGISSTLWNMNLLIEKTAFGLSQKSTNCPPCMPFE